MTQEKQIYTLVDDIHDMVREGVEIPDELWTQFFDDIKDALSKALLQGCQSREIKLRMSNIGTPARKLWYTLKGYPGGEPSPRQAIQFMYGHIIEAFMLMLVRAAGHKVEDTQKRVELEGVIGHQDSRIDGIVMDVKGMAKYGYNKFESGWILRKDSFGYLLQLSGYVQGQGDDIGGFLVFDKESARIGVFLFDSGELKDARKAIKNAKVIIESDTPPERCYEDIPDGKSGNRILGKDCEWCPFKHECWKDANDGKGLRTFKFSTGDKYFTTVKRQSKTAKEILNEEIQVEVEEDFAV